MPRERRPGGARVRSRIQMTWLGVSSGWRASSTAAAALTCGAANDVPSDRAVGADRRRRAARRATSRSARASAGPS